MRLKGLAEGDQIKGIFPQAMLKARQVEKEMKYSCFSKIALLNRFQRQKINSNVVLVAKIRDKNLYKGSKNGEKVNQIKKQKVKISVTWWLFGY